MEPASAQLPVVTPVYGQTGKETGVLLNKHGRGYKPDATYRGGTQLIMKSRRRRKDGAIVNDPIVVKLKTPFSEWRAGPNMQALREYRKRASKQAICPHSMIPQVIKDFPRGTHFDDEKANKEVLVERERLLRHRLASKEYELENTWHAIAVGNVSARCFELKAALLDCQLDIKQMWWMMQLTVMRWLTAAMNVAPEIAGDILSYAAPEWGEEMQLSLECVSLEWPTPTIGCNGDTKQGTKRKKRTSSRKKNTRSKKMVVQ